MDTPLCWCAALLVVQLGAGLVLPECQPGAAQCQHIDGYILYDGFGEFSFNVSGRLVNITYSLGSYFSLLCNYTALDNPMLPRFKIPVHIEHVKIKECAPPHGVSFAAAIAALNVTGFSKLELDLFPETELITHAHFIDLQRLKVLELRGKNNLSLAPGALAALSAAPVLHSMRLESIRTPVADLVHLPRSLQILELNYVDAMSIHIESSPNLTLLTIHETYPITLNLSNAAAIKLLSVNAPNTVIPEDALPFSLTQLRLEEWNDAQPKVKTRCAQLEILALTGTNNETYPLTLPDEWLSNCRQINILHIRKVPIRGVLAMRVLANATSLEQIHITKCNLTALAPGLFDNTPNLTILDMSYNKLTYLPRRLFEHTKSLATLILSHNQLTSKVAWTFSTITSLTELWLNSNHRIGDLCSLELVAGPSPLNSLRNLRKLVLRRTGVSRMCSDWRENLTALDRLDLTGTDITLHSYVDLQFRRNTSVAVVALGHFKVQFTRKDYFSIIGNEDTMPSIKLSGSLKCDCTSYWYAAVFQLKPMGDSELTICGNEPVNAVDPDTLTCPASAQCVTLPDSCTCYLRNDMMFNQVVRVQCRGLMEFPRLPPAAHKWILNLANNNISQLALVNISQDIIKLDLRNNLIKNIDFETASKLASVSALSGLQLANNPLECNCEALRTLAPLLHALSKMQGKNDMTCENGEQLSLAMLNSCTKSSNELVFSLILLILIALAVGGLITRPTVRWYIRMILMRLGWMHRMLDPVDDDRPYDAFLSFAHEDEELVVRQLAARLESGLQPYRLCLHHRDWAPGEWIPAQIAASVRASRRTVAIVSVHYLKSGWSRAEFREATAASLREGMPRLVVVLLDEPNRLTVDIDPELQSYVRNNTYVCWRDPWFWKKLEQALPPPRERRPQLSSPLSVSSPEISRKCSTRKSNPAPTDILALPQRKTDE